jgi:hypothetical protein
MPCPRSCSLRFLHGGASSNLRFIVVAPPGRSDVSRGFLLSIWCKYVEDPSGRVGCTSSRLRSRGAGSWVRDWLLVSSPVFFALVLFFFFAFSFMFELVAFYLVCL